MENVNVVKIIFLPKKIIECVSIVLNIFVSNVLNNNKENFQSLKTVEKEKYAKYAMRSFISKKF